MNVPRIAPSLLFGLIALLTPACENAANQGQDTGNRLIGAWIRQITYVPFGTNSYYLRKEKCFLTADEYRIQTNFPPNESLFVPIEDGKYTSTGDTVHFTGQRFVYNVDHIVVDTESVDTSCGYVVTDTSLVLSFPVPSIYHRIP